MKRGILNIAGLLMALLMLASCNEQYRTYSQYSRKGTLSQKDSAAFFFYKNGDYERASFLFEELQAAYRGQARAKEILYHYAYAKFNSGFYVISAYYFDQYAKLYPADPKTPECTYMVAESYYRESAPSYLDQSFTNQAIEQYQLFINSYPYATQIGEANARINELRERLAKKQFDTAVLYFNREKYKAAVTTCQVMLEEFPDSRYREETRLYMIKAAYELAENSITTKKKNRYLDAVDYYERFIDSYPNSVFKKDAESTYLKTKKALGKISASQQGS
ncbi:MAG: outer membrane protein assembly factor BamD [Bacteroidia bacterium]|nr:outer membrane protein assembly factor BamD [Bacteroidia bacterium]